MTALGSKVFLTYRRSDSAGHTGRLYQGLKAVFGAENVFKDLETIDAGIDFEKAVRQGLTEADVILVVIGPHWATAGKTEADKPRLFEPGDWVHIEVKAALDSGKRVVPVLVGGATMPSKDEIPEDLLDLLTINAHEMSDSRWLRDLETMLAELAGKDEDLVIRRLLEGKRPALDSKPFVALLILGGLLLVELGDLANAVAAAGAAVLCLFSLWQIRQRRTRGALFAWMGLLLAALYLLALYDVWHEKPGI